jgi:hypothetical protein
MDSNKEILLNEIKNSYQHELEQKNNFENKADKYITTSGILLALIFAFATLNSINNDNNTTQNISIASYFGIILSIVFSILSLFYGFKVLKITDYKFILSENKASGKYVENTLLEYNQLSNEKLLPTLIKDYLFAIKLNSDKNLIKERNLVNSEKWFKWFLVSIIITIVLILISKIF